MSAGYVFYPFSGHRPQLLDRVPGLTDFANRWWRSQRRKPLPIRKNCATVRALNVGPVSDYDPFAAHRVGTFDCSSRNAFPKPHKICGSWYFDSSLGPSDPDIFD